MVLAGGRARRLGGVAKPLLRHGGATLLDHALTASRGAALTIVVGPALPPLVAAGAEQVQEDPPFGGPVAALAAALPRLDRPGAPEWVLLLAADLVDPGPAVARLTAVAASADADTSSLLAIDGDGREQLLLGLHRARALRAALADLGDPAGASVRALLAPLPRVLVRVPAGTTDDVDEPADLTRHGIDGPRPAE